MHTQPTPVARTLVFLCVGALSGIIANLAWRFVPGLDFLGAGLVFGLTLLVLLGVHLLRRPQRTMGQTIATVLSPVTATAAFALAFLLILFGAMLDKGILFYTLINLPPDTPDPISTLIADVPLFGWLYAVGLMAVAGVLASSVLTLGLFPLLRPGRRRWLILTGMSTGVLLLACMLMWSWLVSGPYVPLRDVKYLRLFLMTPMFGPFYPIAFGLFAAALAWCLPARVTEKT